MVAYFNGFLVTSPLIADYIKNESRGAATALATIGMLTGECFSMIVLVGCTIDMELDHAYTFTSTIIASMSLFLFCLIREPIIKDQFAKKVKAVVS